MTIFNIEKKQDFFYFNGKWQFYRNLEKYSVKLLLLLSSLLLGSQNLLAHTEHDKARFVSQEGTDQGYCDNALRPCKTIVYAVQRANKGDKVLVASGHYQIQSAEELFYLKSEIVPILAGFNRFDHFQNQSPKLNPTFIAGVPQEMQSALIEKGFQVVRDGKGLALSGKMKQKLLAVEALEQAQSLVACSSGMAGSFPCNNIDLVAHLPLSAFSGTQNAGNDIWGHVDLNTGIEYAIIGLQRGAAVVSLATPENPVEVGVVSGSAATWRDIKVYQYFDTISFKWKAYAYVTIDGAGDGVTIIDLNDLPNSVSLVERNQSVTNAHNVYISNVDYSLNIKLEGVDPVLQLIGAGPYSGSFHSYSLENPETITVKNNQSSFNGYTHDGASVLISDSRATNGCVNGGVSCTVFVDFNEKEMVLWDITDPTDTRHLSTAEYDDVDKVNQYVHSGWVTEDKNYVLLHDEFDEYRGGLNSTVRIFDISNLTSPVKVGQWTGPTRAIDHNGFVRGNRYYMSNYERGLTVLDIENPQNPQEVGYFDTFPSSNNASFNGAWGVYPFLPSGLILVSDINSGLYVLRDNTQNDVQGSVSFTSPSIEVNRGETVDVTVNRVNASVSATSSSVGIEMLSGSATAGEDFVLEAHTISWTGNEAGSKNFSLTIPTDNSSSQHTETFYMRLYNPTNGMTLTSPSYLKVVVNGVPNGGALSLANNQVSVLEGAGSLSLQVERSGGSEGAVSIDYQLVDGSATAGEDYEAGSGTLEWADGDSTDKTVTIILNDDEISEADETFILSLSNATGAVMGTNTSVEVTLLDEESNTPPQVSLADDFEVNAGQQVSLSVTATDAEGDSLSYLWEQTAGSPVSLNNANQANSTFTAPAIEDELAFTITVTDIRGGATQENITVKVVAPPQSSSGGGSLSWWILVLLFLAASGRVELSVQKN
ncbi:choice-of-anchor B family protein [Aliikangiella sp. G2MR2-5]|uniref:choice-of-anchor B family protein n=1 Tax=Aliikangiella sp. G2MR2-5 TaxID=2788943 RepID=UPI0018A92F85|nr:choice-of-anchor B family protein [Aliikangiella sp. G2MR2-5]